MVGVPAFSRMWRSGPGTDRLAFALNAFELRDERATENHADQHRRHAGAAGAEGQIMEKVEKTAMGRVVSGDKIIKH